MPTRPLAQPGRPLSAHSIRILAAQVRRVVLIALLGGFIGATMIRFSPGYGSDEQDLNTAFTQESRDAIRAQRAADSNIAGFYFHYLAGLLKGEFGFSRSFNRPIGELLRERLPETAVSIGYGVAGGIAIGLAFAIGTTFWRVAPFDVLAGASSGLLLSVPAAVIALVFLWTGANGKWAIALLVAPHVYRYSKNVLVSTAESPHVLAAHARGLSKSRILFTHILAPVAPQLIAVAGMSVTLAFSASIPVEVVCDTPGIGQLVWKSALGRDLPLLVTITILVALLTLTINALADLTIATCGAAGAAESR